MIDENFKISIEIDSYIENVFDVLTNPEHIEVWSGDDAHFDNFVGGKINLFSGWVKGKITEFIEYQKVSFSWEPTDWDEDCNSTVTFTFEKKDNLTLFHLEHTNFPDTSEKELTYDGWYDYVINPAMSYLLELQNKEDY